MKAIEIKEVDSLEIIETVEPIIEKDDQVKIKVKYVGICGSDVGIYNGNNPMAIYPRIIGHEMTGEVVDIGSEVKHLKIGDRVVVDPVVSSLNSPQSIIGRPNISDDLQVRGVHTNGFMAEYIVSKSESVYKIPDSMSYEDAVLVEPFSIGSNVGWRAEISPRDTVFVLGAGTAGQTVLRTAILRGARVIVGDIDDAKLDMALEQGAYKVINTNGKSASEEVLKLVPGGVDVAIDAVGMAFAFEEIIKMAAPAGRVIELGFSEEGVPIQTKWITSKELDIRGSRLSNRRFPEVIRCIEDGRLSTKGMVSHVFDVQDIDKAFKTHMDPSIESRKVLVKF